MNPFFERVWPGVHTLLVSYVCEALAAQLPEDLTIRPEEGLTVTALGQSEKGYRADVAVSDSWREGVSPLWQPGTDAGGGVILAKPVVVTREAVPERWVEIRTSDGTLVTLIEILSPTNKTSGSEAYRRKQQRLIEGSVNLVEIDLLRGGGDVLAARKSLIPWRQDCSINTICVTRAGDGYTHELYPCPLRERLPAFGIPLRPTDHDAPLDLQPLLDKCYQTGSYWKHDFSQELDPPFSPDDAAWVQERLRGAGLVK